MLKNNIGLNELEFFICFKKLKCLNVLEKN